jgi:hypothetical protein
MKSLEENQEENPGFVAKTSGFSTPSSGSG